jgi:ribosomal-protein-alanine N-acetyltransferase
MSDAARIARMLDADVDEVGAMEHAIFHQGEDGAPVAIVTSRLRSDLAGPLMRGWVARAVGTGSLVGYLVALHAADEVHVLNVATLPAQRRAGIGRALVEAVLDYARDQRVRLLVLEVRTGNRDAIRLYRRVGFAAITVRRKYYVSGEDAVEMHLELDPATGAVVAHADEVALD